MKVVDEAGQVVPVNTRGEIYVRINSCFKEYCNDPDKTSASLPGEGWFRTGDVGFMSENGVFFCEGKMSDIIISEGLKVGILDAVLRSCPGVSNVVCVPVPHDVMFQVICACASGRRKWRNGRYIVQLLRRRSFTTINQEYSLSCQLITCL